MLAVALAVPDVRALSRVPLTIPYGTMGTLFKGRETFMEELRSSLRRAGEGQTAAIVGTAVHGLGGVGKTRLAVEYAFRANSALLDIVKYQVDDFAPAHT